MVKINADEKLLDEFKKQCPEYAGCNYTELVDILIRKALKEKIGKVEK